MPEPAATRRARPGGAGEWQIRHFASLDSTNRYLADEARAGAPEGLVAVADHQDAGRGRLGRSWEAAPGTALAQSAKEQELEARIAQLERIVAQLSARGPTEPSHARKPAPASSHAWVPSAQTPIARSVGSPS